jgi:outer membrane receptor protein involved in Fe transport
MCQRFLLLVSLLLIVHVHGQNISLAVFDEISREPLPGVAVLTPQQDKWIAIGITDLSGNVTFSASACAGSIQLKHLGHADTTFQCTYLQPEKLTPVFLKIAVNSIGNVVIGSSKYLQPLEFQTVSLDVIKADEMIKRITPDLAKAAERIPGLTIIDGQASIRGGSGYAYGAGTRVLLVVDNQPLITADRNDIKWNYVPLELAEQVEVIKGASSVQFGSAALNGIIHVRTAYPSKHPETFVSSFATAYDSPKNPLQKWWTDASRPYQSGIQFRHKERLKNGFDLVLGGNVLRSRGWLNGEYESRERLTFRTRKIWKDGRKSAGIDGNLMHQKAGFFFLWKNDTTDALIPFSDGTTIDMNDFWANIDPWYTVYDKHSNKHVLRGRYYYTLQVGGKDWSPATHLISAEYQFQKNFKNKGVLVAGFTGNQFFFEDSGLGGMHNGNMGGAYVQFDQPYKKWQFSVGLREELFRIDQLIATSIPVGRAGVNYQAGKNTFIRSSFGQGFRFPSPAERFVKTNLDVIYIYPNPELRPEKGWGAELGVKQRIQIANWKGYVDGCLFLTRYTDLLEFSFGIWDTVNQTIGNAFGRGFKSINITQAQIGGLELSISGDSDLGNWRMTTNGGYTYIAPIDLNRAPDLKGVFPFAQYAIQSFNSDESYDGSPVLKYRYRHMAKFNIDFDSPMGITFGGGVRGYSFMEQVDSIFELFVPNLIDYRINNHGPSFLIDARFGYVKGPHRFTIQVTNVTNTFVTIRPAKPEAPRGFMFQYAFNLQSNGRTNIRKNPIRSGLKRIFH